MRITRPITPEVAKNEACKSFCEAHKGEADYGTLQRRFMQDWHDDGRPAVAPPRPAPGSADEAAKIKNYMRQHGITRYLDAARRFRAEGGAL